MSLDEQRREDLAEIREQERLRGTWELEISDDVADRVPRLDEYFGAWAMRADVFDRIWSYVVSRGLPEHVETGAVPDAAETRFVRDGAKNIAVIEIMGTLTKGGTSLDRSSSTVSIRRQIRAATEERDVAGILLKIDSPGGTVAGIMELAAEVRRARGRKPTVAFVEDMAASAAYWVASQASKIFAGNEIAQVGSIGTFVGLFDTSKAAEKEGIRAVVVKTGELKAGAFPGSPISDSFIGMLQGIVDQTQEAFNAAIEEGRGLTAKKVSSFATGRLWLAKEAVGLRIIDGIRTFNETVKEVGAMASATLEDIVACCPGAEHDNEFVIGQIRAKATLDQAQSAWMERQEERRKKEVEDLKAAQDAEKVALQERIAALEAANKTPGVDPLSEQSENRSKADDNDPVAEWDRKLKAHRFYETDKSRAVSALVKEEPELHEAMREAATAEVLAARQKKSPRR